MLHTGAVAVNEEFLKVPLDSLYLRLLFQQQKYFVLSEGLLRKNWELYFVGRGKLGYGLVVSWLLAAEVISRERQNLKTLFFI